MSEIEMEKKERKGVNEERKGGREENERKWRNGEQKEMKGDRDRRWEIDWRGEIGG